MVALGNGSAGQKLSDLGKCCRVRAWLAPDCFPGVLICTSHLILENGASCPFCDGPVIMFRVLSAGVESLLCSSRVILPNTVVQTGRMAPVQVLCWRVTENHGLAPDSFVEWPGSSGFPSCVTAYTSSTSFQAGPHVHTLPFVPSHLQLPSSKTLCLDLPAAPAVLPGESPSLAVVSVSHWLCAWQCRSLLRLSGSQRPRHLAGVPACGAALRMRVGRQKCPVCLTAAGTVQREGHVLALLSRDVLSSFRKASSETSNKSTAGNGQSRGGWTHGAVRQPASSARGRSPVDAAVRPATGQDSPRGGCWLGLSARSSLPCLSLTVQ